MSNGIDYDLCACLNYNPQEFAVDDIAEVLAVWEGERDGDSWRWILRLNNGAFVFLIGGCCYTGWDCQSWAWDCQSWANSESFVTAEQAAERVLKPSPWPASDEAERDRAVYFDLMRQLTEGKTKIWRESKDEEFGL